MVGRELVVLVVLLIGCGGGDAPSDVGEKTTRDVGTTGGVIELVSGGKVEIPQGALSETIAITVEEVKNPRPFADEQVIEAAGKAFAFKPHGLRFQTPVVIEVPIDGDATDTRPMKLDDDQDTTWQTVVGSQRVGAKLQLMTTSFSIYRAARPRRQSGVIVLPDGAVIAVDAGMSDAMMPDVMVMPDAMISRDAGEEIRFVDPAIENAVRALIDRATGAIYAVEVAAIGDLNIPTDNVTTLADLVYFRGLRTLRLGNVSASSLLPLGSLSELREIWLGSNVNLSGDLADLATLPRLTNIDVSGTGVTGDLADLSVHTGLQQLWIANTVISGSVSSLSALDQLHVLSAYNTALGGDLSALSAQQWVILECDNTNISGDLASITGPGMEALSMPSTVSATTATLSNFASLRLLRLTGSGITGDIAGLAGLGALDSLELNNTAITGDVNALSEVNALTQLRLANAAITGNIAVFADMLQLTELYLPGTMVSGDIAALSSLTQLTSASLSQTMVSGDVSSLAGLTNLLVIALTNTSVSGALTSLSSLPALLSLSLEGTGITGDIATLSSITGLEVLSLMATSVTGSLSALVPLNQLEFANLSFTGVTMDLSPLAANVGVHRIMTLQLTGNSIDCTGQASAIQTLTNAGTVLSTDCP